VCLNYTFMKSDVLTTDVILRRRLRSSVIYELARPLGRLFQRKFEFAPALRYGPPLIELWHLLRSAVSSPGGVRGKAPPQTHSYAFQARISHLLVTFSVIILCNVPWSRITGRWGAVIETPPFRYGLAPLPEIGLTEKPFPFL